MAARGTIGVRGRVVAAAVSIALLGALAAVMAATDGSSAPTHTPSVSSTPVAHTTTGGS
ncbi:MAG: hypothetical protein WD271_14055 [Acidimicrobiia bacterium]